MENNFTCVSIFPLECSAPFYIVSYMYKNVMLNHGVPWKCHMLCLVCFYVQRQSQFKPTHIEGHQSIWHFILNITENSTIPVRLKNLMTKFSFANTELRGHVKDCRQSESCGAFHYATVHRSLVIHRLYGRQQSQVSGMEHPDSTPYIQAWRQPWTYSRSHRCGNILSKWVKARVQA